jgi:hypothetical protein
MSDIVERLRAENERKRDAGGDMLYRGPSDPLLTEAADTITDLRAEVEALKDPNVVHVNMLRGGIARPSLAQIIHIYGEEAIRATLVQTKDTTDDA